MPAIRARLRPGIAVKCIHVIGSRRLGGAERFFVRLSGALVRRGHEVIAALPPHSDLIRILHPRVRRRSIAMRGVWDLESRWRIRRTALAESPAIVQTYMGRATRLTHLPRRSGLVHIARLGGYYRIGPYRHADAWVGNTLGICDHLIREGCPSSRVFQIGNFVEGPPVVDAERCAALRVALELREDERMLLCVARLHPNKGISILLDAFRLIQEPGVVLVVVGDGPLRVALQAHAASIGVSDRVRWEGWIDDPSPYYAVADVFVCPSVHEPLGNVILEAWSQGLPVVATTTDGLREIATDGVNAVLVPPGDPAELAEALRGLLSAPDETTASLARAGAATLEAKHSEECVVGAYEVLYATFGADPCAVPLEL